MTHDTTYIDDDEIMKIFTMFFIGLYLLLIIQVLTILLSYFDPIIIGCFVVLFWYK